MQADRCFVYKEGEFDRERHWADLHFYAVALDHVRLGALWARRAHEEAGDIPNVERVDAAVKDFEQHAPDSDRVRGVMEHEITYDSGASVRGKPKLWTD